ncbi:hypothetical protein EV421DRAFT_1902487 [Armillaria borealis]|uniref:Uncharacterized protein n=1 Tax=Armillaria borealis TaxID=47425 RepID=A0AA39JPD3_9AGAR|nr:hypothetical protein EV421DRAFT_1902487 [Armillaria borealis]
MSSTASPRGQCYTFCLCSRFLPARDVYLCTCGHGAHAHIDYMSPVVHHCPSTHCAAYAQKTLQTQDCTCGAPLADHVATVNAYRLPATLPYVPESLASDVRNASSPSNVGAVSLPDNMNITLSSPSLPISSPSHNLYPSGSQLGTTQADVTRRYQHLNGRYDSDAANGQLYDHSNVMYNATPDARACSCVWDPSGPRPSQ